MGVSVNSPVATLPHFPTLKVMVIEYSVLLGYAVGYIADTETYVIYSLMMFGETAQNLANSVFDLHPTSCVTLVGDEQRAKGLINTPQWVKVIDEINAN